MSAGSAWIRGDVSAGSAWTTVSLHRFNVHSCEGQDVPKRDDLAFIEEALAIDAEDALAAGSLGFYGRVFCQTSLPYLDPGSMPVWSRQAGNLTLSIQPAVVPVQGPGGGVEVRYPYGVIPRLLLIWLTSETVRTKERRLVLDDSLSGFMRSIGLHVTGGKRGDIGRLRSQMERLFLSTVVCRFDAPEEGRAAASRFDVADSYALWWDAKSDPRQGTLLPSYVDLSERFYEEVLGHPVPVDLRAIELLKGSPLRLDQYCWLTYRFSYLRRKTAIPWELLRLQFGSHLADTRQGRHQFKKNFTDHLARVLLVYPGAQVEINETGVVLTPSPPHVRARRTRPAISTPTQP